MRHPLIRALALLALLGFSAALAPNLLCDTIILKNGRHIEADNVQVADGWVSYDTSAGRMSLPQSIVEHVVRDPQGQGSVSGAGSAAGAVNDRAANLAIAPPENLSGAASSEAVSVVIHDGAVDRDALARMESDAQSGDASAVSRVTAAISAVAQFEVAHGQLDQAVDDYRQALLLAPNDLSLLLDSGYLHLKRSEYSQALDDLDHAFSIAPDSPEVAKLRGWAYYGLSRIETAVAEWQRALALKSDPEVQHALDKATRDMQEEANYRENETAHFILRYNGDATPQLAADILRALEDDFSDISNQLEYTPPEAISVVLYTNQEFTDITQAPNWVGALNDGRIRIPVDGLGTVTDALAHVLKHELTHSFLTQKTRGRCPVWLQEGIAQYMEGKRSGAAAASLFATFNDHMDVSLASYEGSWLNLEPDEAKAAYQWSLANVEAIVAIDGMNQLSLVLDRITAGATTEDALRDVLQMGYSDLALTTAGYLRRTYLDN
jgi:tetratricopeptide (TPR) repeat protein